MSRMFIDAYAFNQNIGTWNTAAVTTMERMFDFATAFNQNIGAWNTSAVTDMRGMFADAEDFNQNIGTWTLNPAVNLSNMLNNSGMDCSNYSATLIDWSANPSTPNGRTLGATGRQYGINAVAARSNLTTTKGWTITGDTPSATVCGSNEPPVILSTTTGVWIEGVVTINLLELISDPDDNLDLTTLSTVGSTSEQGASASINASSELVLDYGGILFTGTDRVTIEVCDLLGECSEEEITIEVVGDVIVYNAISPNADDDLNRILVIRYIDVLPDTQENQVTIYNRWGDVVFEVSDYNNADRAFRGVSDNGKDLPSGTYFYKIEFQSGIATKTGFLSLKR
jgi:gliding motility-associated-like protein